MARRKSLLLAGLIAVPALLLVYILASHEIEQRLSARPGGALTADLELGSGISFHRGSLEIASHEDDDVVVVAAVSGWGKYAVDVEARERKGDVHVVGRVEGFLHWIFAGPTVDVRILVPEGYAVKARIDGGPLLLENLSGPVEARAEEGEAITLRGSTGPVKLVAHGGEVDVSEVEGPLKIEIIEGVVDITDVSGTTVVSAQGGGAIRIERARGNLHAATQYGRIHLKEIEGDVDLETEDGEIEIVQLDGRLRARSRHGDVAVEFRGNPSGSVETEGGSIDVEVPASSRFDLEIDADDGSVEMDEGLAFVRAEPPDGELVPRLERDLSDAGEMGLEIAAEVHQKVRERIRRHLERQRERRSEGRDRDEEGEEEDWGENWDWSWDDPDWRWRKHDWALGEEGAPWWGEGGPFEIRGSVNGGGETLSLRTRGGRVKIQD